MRTRAHWGRAPGTAPADPTEPLSIVPGMGLAEEEPDGRLAGRPAMPAPLAEAAALARKHPLETVCVLLIGVGGLIFPFPLWLIGGLVALRSRRWDTRDKRLALLGPPLFAVACVLILGADRERQLFPGGRARPASVRPAAAGGLPAVRRIPGLAAAARPARPEGPAVAAAPLTEARDPATRAGSLGAQ